jgi:hypothetical protein
MSGQTLKEHPFKLAVWGIKISRGFLAKQVEKASRPLRGSYECLVKGLKEAGSINIKQYFIRLKKSCFKKDSLAIQNKKAS